MNNAKRKATGGSADTVGGNVMTALHARVDRVRCVARRAGGATCGEWVDSDPVVQARHLLCCRAASWWTRARAESFLVVQEVVGDDVGDTEAGEGEHGDECSALLADDDAEAADDDAEARNVRPTRRGDVELTPDTAAYVEVLASEDAHLLATGEAYPRLQVVRDLWDVNFLDLPVEARLELRAHGEEVGFLFYATCLSRYLGHPVLRAGA